MSNRIPVNYLILVVISDLCTEKLPITLNIFLQIPVFIMNKFLPILAIIFLFPSSILHSQTEATDSIPEPCQLALDTYDEFDSTRMIATLPIKIGFLVPTKNIAEDFGGKNLTDEAKVVFSYAESEENIRSFFLSLVVVEHQFLNIENDFNVFFKLENGQLVNIYNVPDRAELNKEIIMWMYQHTCVIPLEVYHILKNEKVEKIRINYEGYKRTITLEPDQRQALQDAVICVDNRLREDVSKP